MHIPRPAKFDSKTDDWDHWIKRYELFEAATERDGLSDKVRINTLIYVMGNNAADIYDRLSGEDIQYANVKQKFKDHFKAKVALVFERTQFVRRSQHDKESVLWVMFCNGKNMHSLGTVGSRITDVQWRRGLSSSGSCSL